MQVSTATLANYAVTGEGPIYCLIGKYAYYADPDLDSWAQSRITAPRRKASGDPDRTDAPPETPRAA
jgi:hypothetical protein